MPQFRKLNVGEFTTNNDLKLYAYFINTSGSEEEYYLLPVIVLEYQDQSMRIRPIGAVNDPDNQKGVWTAEKDMWVEV